MLKDRFDRQFSYLRLSLTDACNFRCLYCLPNGSANVVERNYLSIIEIQRLLTAFVELGLEKVRLTGGEPTIRKDFSKIATLLASFPEIKERTFTTNGYYLEKKAKEWKNSHFTGINVSVDSMDPLRFHQITGRNCLFRVLAGVVAAVDAGFKCVKMNVVLLKDFNFDEFDRYVSWVKDKPVVVRFIELMKTEDSQVFFTKHHVSPITLQKKLVEDGWNILECSKTAGPALTFSHPDYQGHIGFISPYSKDFCKTCNRLRISATGNLHLCLFGNAVHPLINLLKSDTQKDELKRIIQQKLMLKRESHYLAMGDFGITKHLASIGG